MSSTQSKDMGKKQGNVTCNEKNQLVLTQNW